MQKPFSGGALAAKIPETLGGRTSSSIADVLMATCPKCGGYLGRNHHCWGGRRILNHIRTALVGALVGFFLPLLWLDRFSVPLLLTTALLGVVLTLAVHRYARF
jgi:hypothetical protein